MGKLLRGHWLWVVAFSRKPIPKPWRSSLSSRDAPSTLFSRITTIPTYIGIWGW
jgi:hypothetical protein